MNNPLCLIRSPPLLPHTRPRMLSTYTSYVPSTSLRRPLVFPATSRESSARLQMPIALSSRAISWAASRCNTRCSTSSSPPISKRSAILVALILCQTRPSMPASLRHMQRSVTHPLYLGTYSTSSMTFLFRPRNLVPLYALIGTCTTGKSLAQHQAVRRGSQDAR